MASGAPADVARRNDVAVKIDADVARVAKIVASFKDISLAEYLTETLRPVVERDLREHSRRVVGPEPGAEPGPKGKGGKP
jgi:hypothetical protein